MDTMTNTPNQDVEAAIISKIEGLFRQANHPNTGEHERKAFHAKALALSEKHRISMAMLDLSDNEAPAEYQYGWVKGLYAKSHQAIIGAVARVYGVRSYYSSSGKPGNPARLIFLFGFRKDCERVQALAEQFIADAMSQAQRYKDPLGGYGASDRTTNWRKSFMMGYAAEIGVRYEEAKHLLDEEQPGWATTGNALVLVSRKDQVDEAFSQIKLRKSSGRTKGFNASGYVAGQEAGRNSTIGRRPAGSIGNTRALQS